MRIQRLLLLFIIVSTVYACSDDPLQVDVSHVEINYTSKRFDKSLFSSDFSDLDEVNQDLYQKFGAFWKEFQEVVLRLGPAGDSATIAECRTFVIDPTIQEIQTEIEKVHDPLMSEYNAQFEDAFKRYSFHFNKPVPQIYFYNSGFNYGIYPMDTIMAVGLDFYLGANHEITGKLPPDIFPRYRQRKMDPKYLVSDAMRGWLVVNNQQMMSFKDLQSQIIDFGKVLYMLDACLPSTPDSIKMNYTPAQEEWAKTNEKRIWQTLARDEVLFETKSFEINKWVSDGPFTNAPNVPQDSPPQLGIWMGWQIVKDYMRENPETTFEELIAENDYTKMLRFYQPGN